jgi:hypothetical protein
MGLEDNPTWALRDDPELASYLRIKERELEGAG